MSVSARFIDLLPKGLASGRPAASAVGKGALYSSTDTGVIEQSDGTSWSTWATLSGGGSGTVDSVVAGTNVSVDSTDPANPVVSASMDLEAIRDAIGACLVAGANVTITVDDTANTITIASAGGGSTDPEVVRDTIAAALVAGTGVTITPNDGADTITIDATGGGSTDPEVVRDTIAAALVEGANIDVTVNDAGDTITIAVTGLADSDVAPVAPNDQTGTTYTFVLADKHRLVTGNNASAQTFTIPPNSSVAYPVGAVLEVYQKGAGQVTLAAGAGVTIRTPRGAKTAVQYAFAFARQVATDVWAIGGDVAA